MAIYIYSNIHQRRLLFDIYGCRGMSKTDVVLPQIKTIKFQLKQGLFF